MGRRSAATRPRARWPSGTRTRSSTSPSKPSRRARPARRPPRRGEYECAADAEDAPDPLEQLAEHVVEGEAAERHLDDALHPSQQLRRAFRVAARLVLADQQPAALV